MRSLKRRAGVTSRAPGLGEGSLLQLGYGRKRRYVAATVAETTSAVGVDIASDKHLTKALLERAFVPVPPGRVVTIEEEALEAFSQMRAPVVVKPLDGNQGKAVSLDLYSADDVASAFRAAREISREVIIEEMIEGRDYRLLLVDGKIVAASERTPAHVFGDGMHTIAELVEIENRNALRGDDHEKPLTKLRLSDAELAHLRRQGLAPDSVPGDGRKVLLLGTANLSTGGTAADVTDIVHPEIRTACERAARVLGLNLCGIDLVTPDIARPLSGTRGGIVEVNAAPGIRMHHHPSAGTSRDAGAAIVEHAVS